MVHGSEVVCGRDEGVNGAWGERKGEGSKGSLEKHQDDLSLPSHFKTNANGTE